MPLLRTRHRARSRAAAFGTALALVLAVAWPAARALEPGAKVEPALVAGAGEVLVVHFWATWCTPCRGELESLAAFYRGPYRALERRGLRLLTVSNDARARDLERFRNEQQLPFPVLLDSLSELNDRLSLYGLPATVVIDREGRVAARLIGVQDWESREFLSQLETFLEP